jgi:hypothetical protein
MPPSASSCSADIRPAALNASSAALISGISRTRSPSKVGSSRSLLRLWVAKRSVAICSAVSSAASKVSRECSA